MPEANGVVVRPGDTLIVCIPSEQTAAEIDRLSNEMQEKLPGITVCVLTGVSQIAAYQPKGGTP